MKIHQFLLFFLAVLIVGCIPLKPKPAEIPYQTVDGDPLSGRIYTLENGLTVFMTVNKDEPRIQTLIGVKAGHKNDPPDATGLAHYLEHMLFKGTDKFGTADWEKESAEIDKIIALYDKHYVTTDSLERKQIYHQIDSISTVAAKYAIPNEYTKMVTSMGAKGTNAYTWVEQTVYINDIPANQINNWLKLEAERYRHPVMRLFHTELETVYEEKNRGLDNDNNKVDEALSAELFKKHPYGTQTTIGSIEHLKNPSLSTVIHYYDTYYVPTNMVISLSGDLNPDEVIQMIRDTWGKLPSRPVPEFIPPKEDPITQPVIGEVVGPDAESVTIGFRFGGAGSPDEDLLAVTSKIIANQTAGLIDLNLNQEQKVLGAFAFPQIFKDYSVYTLVGRPREGQSLEEVKDLLLYQLELLKKGEFPDWLLDAVRNDLKLKELKGYENNWVRAHAFVNAFIQGRSWENEVHKHERYAKFTKQDIVRFATQSFKNNYAVVYKRVGEDQNVMKVTKPEITPLDINREGMSHFAKSMTEAKVPEIKPVFIDYQKDIQRHQLNEGIPMYFAKNTENDLFRLVYLFEMGTNNDPGLDIALNYLNYLGTSQYSPAEINQEFYKIGCSFSVNASEEQIWVSLSGLQEKMEKGIRLFESLLSDAQANESALENLKADQLKVRADNKLSKNKILWGGLLNYGKYGKNSPFTHILSQNEIMKISSGTLLAKIHNLAIFKHTILYYGPADIPVVKGIVDTYHQRPDILSPIPPAMKFTELDSDKNRVFIVNYDMKQAEIMFLSKGELYNPHNVAERTLFNTYYGGSMSSITFQTIREAKALAYSVFATYDDPDKMEDYHHVMAYIGTQVDKLPEAMSAMFELLNELPESRVSFESSVDAVANKIQTDRVTRSSILFNYLTAQKRGLDHDIRKDVYDRLDKMTIREIKDFFEKHVKGRKYQIMIIGNVKDLNLAVLADYGEIKYLTLEELFGY